MYNHNKAQQSKNRMHISCDILYHLTSIGIPMSRIRRSHDRLIFNMKILIPGKDGLYIRSLYRNGDQICLLSWSLIRGSSGLDKRGPMMTSPLHAHTLCITWPVVRTLRVTGALMRSCSCFFSVIVLHKLVKHTCVDDAYVKSQHYSIFRTGGILWSVFGMFTVATALMLLFSVVQLTSVSLSDNVQHMKALALRNYSYKPATTISSDKGVFVVPSSKLYTLLLYRGIGADEATSHYLKQTHRRTA